MLGWRLWGQKSLDPERYPDIQQLMNDLHALHANMIGFHLAHDATRRRKLV